MKKITEFILNKKIWIISILAILIALSVVGYLYTNVNSDLTTYLSNDSVTKIGYASLDEVFNIAGDCSLAVSNTDKKNVAEIVAYLESLTYTENNVDQPLFSQVIWLGTFDSMQNISVFQDGYEIAKDKFYIETEKDNEIIPTYVIFMYVNLINTDNRVMDAVDKIDLFLTDYVNENGGEYILGGSATNSRSMLKTSVGEVPKYLLVAVAVILVILLITTKSYLEPLIYLATLGIAIILNVGSNIIMGTVSSITLSSSTILQLALSMDYAIFLMHTYYEERETSLTSKDAMLKALPRTITSISASAVTTIGGFIALMFMKYKIGLDLGVCLAKGVLISLISVVLIQPILITLLDKPISKTKHKFFTPALKRTGKFSIKARWVFLSIALLLIVPCFIAQFYAPLGYLTTKKDSAPKNISEEVLQRSSNQLLVVIPMKIENGEIDINYGYDKCEVIKNIENVSSTFSFFDLVNRDDYNSKLSVRTLSNILQNRLFRFEDENGNIVTMTDYNKTKNNINYVKAYSMITVTIDAPVESDATYNAVEKVIELSNNSQSQYIGGYYITGTGVGAYELSKVTPSDFNLVTILSAVLILLVLIFTFKDILLSIILVLVIELGIWINLTIVAIPYLLTLWFPSLNINYEKINFMAYIIISSIQLGATVDYAILITSKFKEELKNSSLKDAICSAVQKGSPSVIVSSAILIFVCIAVNLVTENLIVAQITKLIARGSLISCIFVVTLLPGVLYMVYQAKDKIKSNKRKNKELPNDSNSN